MRIVWETLRDKRGLTMSYDTFRRLCKEAGLNNVSRIQAVRRRSEEAGGGAHEGVTAGKRSKTRGAKLR